MPSGSSRGHQAHVAAAALPCPSPLPPPSPLPSPPCKAQPAPQGRRAEPLWSRVVVCSVRCNWSAWRPQPPLCRGCTGLESRAGPAGVDGVLGEAAQASLSGQGSCLPSLLRARRLPTRRVLGALLSTGPRGQLGVARQAEAGSARAVVGCGPGTDPCTEQDQTSGVRVCGGRVPVSCPGSVSLFT